MKKNRIPMYKDNVAPIRYADKKEQKRRAKQALEEARMQEKEQTYTSVKINSYTTILVKNEKVNRHKSVLA